MQAVSSGAVWRLSKCFNSLQAVIRRLGFVHLQLIRIRIRRHENARRQRLIPNPIDRLARRHRHRQMRAAMKRTAEHDGVLPLRRVLGQLHRRFDDLRAAVAEEVFAQLRPRNDRRQFIDQFHHRFVIDDVGLTVDQLRRLIGDGLRHFGMRVAGARHADARREVEVTASLGIDEINAFAALDHHVE